MRSAVILAGGAGTRLAPGIVPDLTPGFGLGIEKSLLLFSDKPLIQWSFERLSRVCDEVVIVARDRAQADLLRVLVPGAVFACDAVRGYGPLAGIVAGMAAAGGDYAFVSGCDLPFLNACVVDLLFDRAEGFDAAVPSRPDGLIEPLHSVYDRVRMETACRDAMASGKRKISSSLEALRVRYVPVEEIEPLDPGLLTFFNINTKDDLDLAREIWSRKGQIERI